MSIGIDREPLGSVPCLCPGRSSGIIGGIGNDTSVASECYLGISIASVGSGAIGVIGLAGKSTNSGTQSMCPILIDGLCRSDYHFRIRWYGTPADIRYTGIVSGVDEIGVAAYIDRFYGIGDIETSIDTGYRKRSCGCSVCHGNGFGKYSGFIVCKRCNDIPAMSCRVAGNGVGLSSKNLAYENIPGSGTLPFSVSISSEIGDIAGAGSGEIDSRSSDSLLNRRVVFIDEDSDFISRDIHKSVGIIRSAGAIGIGLIDEVFEDILIGPVRNNFCGGVPGFEIPHKLCFLLGSAHSIDISCIILGIKGISADIDDPRSVLSNISLIRKHGIDIDYLYGVFGERIGSGFYIEDGKPLLEGFEVAHSDGIASVSIDVLQGYYGDSGKDDKDGYHNDQFNKSETIKIVSLKQV